MSLTKGCVPVHQRLSGSDVPWKEDFQRSRQLARSSTLRTIVKPRRLRSAQPKLEVTSFGCLPTAFTKLEDKIKEKISEDYQEKVSLQTERDLFVRYVPGMALCRTGLETNMVPSVISSCIVVLLRELEAACEPAFASMIKTQWGALDTVSGESHYVSDLVKAVGSVLEAVRPHIEQKKYLRNFYDKAARYG